MDATGLPAASASSNVRLARGRTRSMLRQLLQARAPPHCKCCRQCGHAYAKRTADQCVAQGAQPHPLQVDNNVCRRRWFQVVLAGDAADHVVRNAGLFGVPVRKAERRDGLPHSTKPAAEHVPGRIRQRRKRAAGGDAAILWSADQLPLCEAQVERRTEAPGPSFSARRFFDVG